MENPLCEFEFKKLNIRLSKVGFFQNPNTGERDLRYLLRKNLISDIQSPKIGFSDILFFEII